MFLCCFGITLGDNQYLHLLCRPIVSTLDIKGFFPLQHVPGIFFHRVPLENDRMESFNSTAVGLSVRSVHIVSRFFLVHVGVRGKVRRTCTNEYSNG